MKAVNSSFDWCRQSAIGLIVLGCSACGVSACAMTAIDDGVAGNSVKPESQGQVEIQFGNWRRDLPIGLSLVVPGGGLVNNGFPAISADRKLIAVFYYARHPLEDGYPTLDVYSTASLRLQNRVDFFPEHQRILDEKRQDPDLSDPDLVARIERRVIEVNRMLAEDGYRSMDTLYEVPAARGRLVGVEKFGKRINYPSADGSLVVASSTTGQIELKLKMPIVQSISGSQDPLNDCEVQGDAEHAWFDPETQIAVMQMTFNSARDGCEQPERWLLERLR